MMHIGKLLGAKKFVKYQERFGFGTKTGIDLPNETRGLVYGIRIWVRRHLQLTHLDRTLQ
ncbi:MAG: penicillin-binding transpeptidase domain-containing protein [Eubacterium ventriosum]